VGGDFFWGRFFFSSLKSGKVSIYDGEGRGGGEAGIKCLPTLPGAGKYW